MRLNPFYPSDDPMSSVFYCFGGGGDSGGGGNSGAAQAIAEQEAYDAAGGSPSQNFSSGRGGGGGNDNDNNNDNNNDNRPSPAPSFDMDSEITQQDYNNLQGGRSVIEQIFAERAGAFPGPTNISLMDQLEDLQQGVNMRQAELDAFPSIYKELMPAGVDFRTKEITELQNRLDDTFKSYTDLQGQFGTQSDQLAQLDEQFGLSQQQIQDQAARIAEQEEAARRNRILGIAGVAPVASSAMTQDDVYNLFGGPGPGSTVPVIEAGMQADISPYTVDQVINMAPSAYASQGVPRLGDITQDRAVQLDLAASQGTSSAEMDRSFFAPLNDLLGLSPDQTQRVAFQINVNPETGAREYGPVMQEAPTQYGETIGRLFGNAITVGLAPLGLGFNIGDVRGYIDPATGERYQYSEVGGIIPEIFGGGQPQLRSYAEMQAERDAEMARDNDGDQAAPPALTLPDPVTEECPEGYTRDGSGVCVYEGRSRVGVTPYTPMAPVEFSYTGLPSLAPRTLTPTAPNMDFLRRSQTGSRYPDLQPIAPGGDFGLPPGVRTQGRGPSGPVNIPTYGDIRDARQFSRPQRIAGLTKS